MVQRQSAQWHFQRNISLHKNLKLTPNIVPRNLENFKIRDGYRQLKELSLAYYLVYATSDLCKYLLKCAVLIANLKTLLKKASSLLNTPEVMFAVTSVKVVLDLSQKEHHLRLTVKKSHF